MEKYYKLKEGKVIQTVTTIPEHMWERKGLLPYEKVVNIEFSKEERKESNIETLDDKVIETVTRYVIQPTLEEVRTNKINEIRNSYEMEVTQEYPLFDQSLASLGMLPPVKIQEMKDFIQTSLDKKKLLISQINELTTISEVNSIEWNNGTSR